MKIYHMDFDAQIPGIIRETFVWWGYLAGLTGVAIIGGLLKVAYMRLAG